MTTSTSSPVTLSNVKERTGKTWVQWFRLLDAERANTWPHAKIARWLQDEHEAGTWWGQMIAVAYERERGLLELNEEPHGHTATVNHTFAVSRPALFRAVSDGRRRRRWLGVNGVMTRSESAPAKIRFAWPDGRSRVEMRLTPKGAGKVQLTVEHWNLASKPEIEKMRAFWKERLGALEAIVAD